MTKELSKDEFLADPLAAWNSSDASFRDEWLFEAIQNRKFREHLAHCVAESVSKVGDFDYWFPSLVERIDDGDLPERSEL